MEDLELDIIHRGQSCLKGEHECRNMNERNRGSKRKNKLLLISFVGLLKEEVGCKFLVLIAGEISLDHRISGETKSAELVEC